MLLAKIHNHLKDSNKNLAFFIEENYFSYSDLHHKIAGIQKLLLKNKVQKNDIVLVNVYNDIETYASILAIWFLGATFVPINTKHAKKRNVLIEKQIKYKVKLSSNPNDENSICTKEVNTQKEIVNNSFSDQILYILFTSGSTGVPKGVPISHENLQHFIVDFANEFPLQKTDKFLQIYDLTFDASIHCYVLPLFLGASVFTVSPNKIKYLEAYKIMKKQQITFAKFPPSVLTYLQAFFNRIQLPNLKYSLLGGESLDATLAQKWQNCIPNAAIFNVYGPTEATINTHIFNFTKNYNATKNYRGTVAIGKTFGNNKAFVVNDKNEILPANTKGELCLFGKQLTKGYFNNDEKNKTAFFYIDNQKVYKTGDIAKQDNDGDFIFYGRKDHQVQIQGYRVELQEIVEIAKQFGNALQYVAVAVKNKLAVNHIVLFSENLQEDTKKMHQFLQNNLPTYMVPFKIVSLDKFPQTASGKTDYNTLKEIALQYVN